MSLELLNQTIEELRQLVSRVKLQRELIDSDLGENLLKKGSIIARELLLNQCGVVRDRAEQYRLWFQSSPFKDTILQSARHVYFASKNMPDLVYSLPSFVKMLEQALPPLKMRISRNERIRVSRRNSEWVTKNLEEAKSLEEANDAINYFRDFLNRADADYLRGSMLIMCCRDSRSHSPRFREWLSSNIRDAATLMLAAAESAVRSIQAGRDVVVQPGSSETAQSAEVRENSTQELPPATDNVAEEIQTLEEAEPQPGSLPSEAIEEAEATTSDTDSEGSYKWLGPNDPLPSGFDEREFRGQLWQIAWALGELQGDQKKRIINSCLRKQMIKALNDNDLCGRQKARNDFIVYVTKAKEKADLIPAALVTLKEIQERGPYHHEDDDLQEEYKRHEESSIEVHFGDDPREGALRVSCP